MRRVMLRLLAGIGILIALAAIGFIVWGSTPQAPTEVALQAMVSDSAVRVETEPWITFTPTAAPNLGPAWSCTRAVMSTHAPTRHWRSGSPRRDTRWSSCRCRWPWRCSLRTKRWR